MTAGHVFVTRGDLTRVWCDAWLMPCAADFDPRPHWYERLHPDGVPRSVVDPEFPRARRLADWPTHLPQPWMVDVGGGRNAPVDWFVAGVSQWLDACGPTLAERSVTGRARPLAALPLVGTGLGGAAERSGDVVRALLPVLYAGARTHGIDIALITHDGPAHAAALETRRRLAHAETWPRTFSTAHRAQAERLAGHARRGNLVVFLGAGVSMGAGLPGWGDLLAALAREVGMGAAIEEDATVRAAFDALSPLDRARLIAQRLPESGPTLGALTAAFVSRYEHYGLGHLALAALPARGAVTTNYDRLYELASEDVGDPVSVLPYEPSAATRSWVLKMHGCVTRPEDIVLTRADFLRYDQRRAALRGVVQAMLLTRHMLFVGFSMNDDNFHRIVDDVRQAVRGERSTVDGDLRSTTLSIEQNPFFDGLWSGEIDRVDLSSPLGQREGARMVEVFLDYLGASSVATTGHLLDDRWAALLDDGELELRAQLQSLESSLTPAARSTEAWKFIEVWLGRLGRSAGNRGDS